VSRRSFGFRVWSRRSEARSASGVATWTSFTLSPGVYTAGVYYQGDATHLSSVAAANNYEAVTFRVVGPPSIITLADPNGNPAIVQYGNGLGALSITVADSAGYLLQGVDVNFSATPGLSIAHSSTTTNASGVAYMYPSTSLVGSFTATITIAGYATPLHFGFQILPAPLTVTIDTTAFSRLYGAANPTLTNTVTGLVGSETVTVTDTLAATAASPVGSYPVSATISGPDAPHFALTVDGFNLQVTKAPLYISASNVSTIYGQTPPQPIQYSLSGFVNGDTASVVTGAPVLTTTVTSTTPAGFYKIGVQVGTLSAANYYFETTSAGEGSVEVVKKALLAVANNQTMTQGRPVPALTYTLSGFVNGDTAANSVTGSPEMFTTATSSSPPGKYLISGTIGTLASQNYTFTRVNGTLTVLP